MIDKIENIRDLLVVAMAPDLRTAIRNIAVAQGSTFDPAVEDMQLIAALMIDSLTPKSFQLLAELQAKRAAEAKKKHH